jgi:hypothetical protein
VGGPSQARRVKQVPESVSRRYRNRVRKCQAGTGSTLSSMNRNFTRLRRAQGDPGSWRWPGPAPSHRAGFPTVAVSAPSVLAQCSVGAELVGDEGHAFVLPSNANRCSKCGGTFRWPRGVSHESAPCLPIDPVGDRGLEQSRHLRLWRLHGCTPMIGFHGSYWNMGPPSFGIGLRGRATTDSRAGGRSTVS